jgi:hypothetical protein
MRWMRRLARLPARRRRCADRTGLAGGDRPAAGHRGRSPAQCILGTGYGVCFSPECSRNGNGGQKVWYLKFVALRNAVIAQVPGMQWTTAQVATKCGPSTTLGTRPGTIGWRRRGPMARTLADVRWWHCWGAEYSGPERRHAAPVAGRQSDQRALLRRGPAADADLFGDRANLRWGSQPGPEGAADPGGPERGAFEVISPGAADLLPAQRPRRRTSRSQVTRVRVRSAFCPSRTARARTCLSSRVRQSDSTARA